MKMKCFHYPQSFTLTSIQFRTEKNHFLETFGHRVTWNGQKYFPTKLPFFFNIESGFLKRFGFFNFCQEKFSYICLVIIFVFFFTSICLTFFAFIQVQRKKAETKKLSKKLSTKAMKNYAERAWLTFSTYKR